MKKTMFTSAAKRNGVIRKVYSRTVAPTVEHCKILRTGQQRRMALY